MTDREAFEKWMRASGAGEIVLEKWGGEGKYLFAPTQLQWQAWQAACEYKTLEYRP